MGVGELPIAVLDQPGGVNDANVVSDLLLDPGKLVSHLDLKPAFSGRSIDQVLPDVIGKTFIAYRGRGAIDHELYFVGLVRPDKLRIGLSQCAYLCERLCSEGLVVTRAAPEGGSENKTDGGIRDSLLHGVL